MDKINVSEVIINKYKLSESLADGILGHSVLVRSLNDDRDYVLKEIECKDESDAHAAIKEINILKDLNHAYISTFIESFSKWDPVNSSISCCIIMDYYKMGSLSNAMSLRHERREIIEEDLIILWFGQIISALIFLHEQNLIHRNLKPQNIYVQEEMNIKVGDLGISVLISDAATHARSPMCTCRYVAPECWSNEFSEKSDAWSVGVIMLDLMKCGFVDKLYLNDIVINEDESSVSLSMDPIEEFSAELQDLVKRLIQFDSSPRPSPRDLSETDYVKSCLEIVDPIKIYRYQRKASALSHHMKRPETMNLEDHIQYLTAVSYDETQALDALIAIFDILRQDYVNVSEFDIVVVFGCMEVNLDNMNIQKVGLDILNIILALYPQASVLFSEQPITIVLQIIENFKTNLDCIIKGLLYLSASSEIDECARIIGTNGGIEMALNLIKEFMSYPDVIERVCDLLWKVCISRTNARHLIKLDGILLVNRAISNYMNSSTIMNAVSSIIISIASCDESMIYFENYETVPLLIQSLHKLSHHPSSIKFICFALASLISQSQENALHVLMQVDTGKDKTGFTIILDIFRSYSNDWDLVESILATMKELSVYSDVAVEMNGYDIIDTVLLPSLNLPQTNERITNLIETTKKNLLAVIVNDVDVIDETKENKDNDGKQDNGVEAVDEISMSKGQMASETDEAATLLDVGDDIHTELISNKLSELGHKDESSLLISDKTSRHNSEVTLSSTQQATEKEAAHNDREGHINRNSEASTYLSRDEPIKVSQETNRSKASSINSRPEVESVVSGELIGSDHRESPED